MSYRPSICFCPADMDACAYWRMWVPHLNVRNSRFMFTMGTPLYNEIAENDVIVVQRMYTEQNMMFLRVLREHGIRIIYDLDDNLWHLPKTNPAHVWFSSEQAQVGLDACAEWADVLTVSTNTLRKVVSRKFEHLRNVATGKPIPVVTVENCVDPKLFPLPEVSRKDDRVVIGWGGSNTHAGDLAHVWKVLFEVLSENPNVYLELVGESSPPFLRNHNRVRHRPWCHISEFAKRYATWNWDIVLAPLDDNRFNQSKSSIKMQEAAAIAKPCLASDVTPYTNFTSHDPELKWLICNQFSWKSKLTELVRNPDRRKHYGDLMYANVQKNYNIGRTEEQWRSIGELAYSQ